jgi:hypothetical protein
MNPILQTLQTDILAPFEIWEVPLDVSKTLKFHNPLILKPEWLPDDPDEPDENDYLSVIYPDLAIDSCGSDREELQKAIISDIRFAWRHFVQLPDNDLSGKSLTIKHYYLANTEVVDG